MPAGSPTSDKYVVYTVDTEDSSSGVEDGQIVFRDPDSMNGLKRMPMRSLSSDSWGPYWSKREKCCCLWNVFLILVVICLAVVFIVMHKALNEPQSDSDNSSMVRPSSGPPDRVTDRRVTPATPAPRETICSSHDCVRLAGSILSRMNTDTDPCEDFYEYSCGGFQRMAYLTWEAPRVRENPDVLLQKYEDFLKDRLSAPNDQSVSRCENKLKVLYRSCLRRRKVPLDTIISALQELLITMNTSYSDDNERGLTKLVAMVTKNFGASPFFKVIVDRNEKISIINNYSDDIIHELFDEGDTVANFRHLMPSDLYYRDSTSDKVLLGYKSFLRRATRTVLDSPDADVIVEDLIKDLDSVYELEISLNKKWYKDENKNALNSIEHCESKMNISTLQKMFPGYGISWELFFKILFEDTRNVTGGTDVCCVDLSPSVQGVIQGVSPGTLARYVALHTILHTDIYTIYAERIRPFNFSTSIYTPPKHSNDEVTCISFLSTLLPLSAIVTIPKLDIFEKESQMLFVNLKQTLLGVVDGLYWIPKGQRRALVAHMDNIAIHFEWTPWKVLIDRGLFDITKLRGGYVANMLALTRLKHNVYLLGMKVHPIWRMAISKFVKKYQTVELSASAIHGPVFYSPATVPVTYGSTGVLIARTLVQAFDIDAMFLHFMTGLIDRRVLFTMAHHLQCLIDTFNRHSLIDSQGSVHQVRGDLTKGENFRDTLALHVAFRAYSRSFDRGYDRMLLPGLNVTDHQLFFITYTQTLCEKVNARGVEMYYMDTENPELPRYIRVLGSLSNFPNFSTAYRCTSSSPMDPTPKCIVL